MLLHNSLSSELPRERGRKNQTSFHRAFCRAACFMLPIPKHAELPALVINKLEIKCCGLINGFDGVKARLSCTVFVTGSPFSSKIYPAASPANWSRLGAPNMATAHTLKSMLGHLFMEGVQVCIGSKCTSFLHIHSAFLWSQPLLFGMSAKHAFAFMHALDMRCKMRPSSGCNW